MPNPADQDACGLLDADHLAVKHLFVRYARLATEAGADDGGQRRQVAMKICDELTVHAQIEEEIFYPALQRALPSTSDVLEEARAEHQEAKDMVARLRGLSAGEEMDQLVAELAGAIEHHVKEERDELFPKARSAPGLDLLQLATELRERQAALEAGQGAAMAGA